ncbi:MAG: sugar ABC transporter permease [Chloroflexi bacterium]|nr:sugar ABC transporter permease [Chloroflexota bacterium]
MASIAIRRVAPAPLEIGKHGAARRKRLAVAPYVLVLPGIALLAVWAYYPLAETIRLSFFDGTLVGGVTGFVGLKNYGDVVRTPEFQKALINTFKYIAGLIPLAVVLPMAVALLAFDIRGKARDFYRSVIFTPMIMAPVVVSLIWLWILNPVQGVLNAVLHGWLELPALNWLGDEHTAIWAIVAITGWKVLGFSFILYLAAISNIDREYLAAARIDGATEWQVIRHIVFPLLTPTFYFLLLFTVLFAGQWAFAPINVLTQGQPNYSTSNVFYVLYQIAFQYFNVGQSAAASILVFAVMGAGIVLGLRLMDRRAHFDS